MGEITGENVPMEKKQGKTGRLFKSGVLEKLTRVHPAIAVTYNLFFILSFLVVNYKMHFVSGALNIIGLFMSGFFLWTLAEYLLHRYFFHMKGTFFKPAKKISYTMHGIHHDYPNDFYRLFMPPVPAGLFITFFFGVFYLILRTSVFVFLPGFMFGYLCYAFTHFRIHSSKAPPLLKKLWVHHQKHHYQGEEKAYGVSSPFWDIVFRTLPSKRIVDREASVKKEVLPD